MNFNMQCQVGALFQFEVYKSTSHELVKTTPWFPNLVLNSGLVRMGNGEWIDRVSVGTGNSEPRPEQVSLDSLVATTSTRISAQESSGTSLEGPKPYVWARIRFRFDASAAKGNIAEVGLGWSGGLWNRALIRDLNGDPTTITVLEDEFLDIIAEVRMYLNSGVGSFDLLDKTGAIRSSHTSKILPLVTGGGSRNFDRLNMTDNNAFMNSPTCIYPTDIISETQRPSGSVYYRDRYIGVHDDYATAYQLTKTISLSIDQASMVHRSFVFGAFTFGGEGVGYQIQIDPPITKTSLQAMNYVFRLSWSNYEP